VRVATAGTGYLALHAPGLTPCSTAAIAARRRARWPDWSFGDDREAHCARLIGQGEVYVRLARGRTGMRFCASCAARVLGLPVRYESVGRVPECC
jgi:hypothetical protein